MATNTTQAGPSRRKSTHTTPRKGLPTKAASAAGPGPSNTGPSKGKARGAYIRMD
jgi:hypothetical protein